MGIPSYFSYIIKNHRRIIETLSQVKSRNEPFDSLYMDCNSIIYDIYYQFISSPNYVVGSLTHDYIIDKVIIMIGFYVQTIQPTRLVYIAFDGVAPFAKMEQQRTRRYKSWFQTTLVPSYNESDIKHQFITAEITPGTEFMAKLSTRVTEHFANYQSTIPSNRHFTVSGSDNPGEGEHKMFCHIRQSVNILANKNVAVYGLDSDLIMLSIFHCFVEESEPINIYIFRESNEFVKSVPGLADTGTPYFLDIRQLAILILCEMTGKTAISDKRDISRIYDYVFLCFMLGNDFLPHFPAMNIRTHGIQVLLEMYKTHIGKYSIRGFIKGGKICWRWFSYYVKELAKFEHEWIVQEVSIRDKMDGRFYPEITAKDREQILLNAPTIHREKEKYIAVNDAGWEGRYYRALFTTSGAQCDEFIKGVCINYLEGLEWVFKYYTTECADWRWNYKHHYPPLLVDLQKYIPSDNSAREFITDGSNEPYAPSEQLAFVLPPAYSHLLPETVSIEPVNMEFEWAFCRYFWESHIIHQPKSRV